MYRSADELRARIEKYFKDCKGHVAINPRTNEPIYNRLGLPVMVDEEPPTVTGLAYALGFHSRQSLLNYEGRPAFEELITAAKLRIEAYTEGRLFSNTSANGAKFSLANNFDGWGRPFTEEHNDDGIMEEVKRRLDASAAQVDDLQRAAVNASQDAERKEAY